MVKNVHFILFLTVLSLAIFTSCKNEKSQEVENVDPETDYMTDYEGPVNKWGFLNMSGETVIPAKYDLVSGFQEGLAPVNLDGHWGYIDQNDSVIIPFTFRAAWQFHNGTARVTEFSGVPCMLHRDGSKICPEGILDLSDFSEGLAVFQKGPFFGFMDTSGNVAIEARFEQAWRFDHGLARVKLKDKLGLIDTQGTFVIPAEFDKVYTPSTGRILVANDGQFYFLDMQGRKIGSRYDHASPYQDSIAAVANLADWRLVDLNEKPLTDLTYNSIRPADEGRWIARKGNLLAVLDSHGKEITPFKYSQINNFSEGFAAYLRDGLWGYMDTTGKEFTLPQFGLAWDFHDGMARAAFQDGVAFITTGGEIPFRPEYHELRDFSEGLAPFQE